MKIATSPLASGIFCLSTSVFADGLFVHNFSGALRVQTRSGVSNLGRDSALKEDTQIILANDQGLVLKDKNKELSLGFVGPALLHYRVLEDQKIMSLEYGKMYVLGKNNASLEIQAQGERLKLRNWDLSVQIPTHQKWVSVFNFSQKGSWRNQTLEPNTLYAKIAKNIKETPLSLEQRQKERSFFEIMQDDFDQKEIAETIIKESLRNSLVISQIAGFNWLLPTSGSSYEQKTLSLGFSFEWTHKRYLNFPLSPRRAHYLKSPAVNLGLGSAARWADLKPLESADKKTRAMDAYGIVGLSWLGLSFNAIGGYRSISSPYFELENPILYSFRASYEWDLKEETLAENGLILGLSYTPSKFQRKTGTDVPVFSPENPTWRSLEVSLGLNFRL